jgi:hypothetical protein
MRAAAEAATGIMAENAAPGPSKPSDQAEVEEALCGLCHDPLEDAVRLGVRFWGLGVGVLGLGFVLVLGFEIMVSSAIAQEQQDHFLFFTLLLFTVIVALQQLQQRTCSAK